MRCLLSLRTSSRRPARRRLGSSFSSRASVSFVATDAARQGRASTTADEARPLRNQSPPSRRLDRRAARDARSGISHIDARLTIAPRRGGVGVFPDRGSLRLAGGGPGRSAGAQAPGLVPDGWLRGRRLAADGRPRPVCLKGRLDRGRAGPVSWWFEYGPTTGYGARTSPRPNDRRLTSRLSGVATSRPQTCTRMFTGSTTGRRSTTGSWACSPTGGSRPATTGVHGPHAPLRPSQRVAFEHRRTPGGARS